MTTTLVTGGNGFIGKHVVNKLIEDGRKVIIVDHRSDSKAPSGAELFLADMRSEVSINEAMAHADSFIHLGGVLGTAETIDNPVPAAYTNILGGLNVLEAAAQYKLPGVNIAVGNHWENNTYSITKSTVERFVHMYNSYRGTNVTIVRALNAYGPGQSIAAPFGDSKVRKIMPSFICRALKDMDLEVYSDPKRGSSQMDMIYVEDVANILVSSLYHTEQHGHAAYVIEAGTGSAPRVVDIAKMVVDIVGSGRVKELPMRRGETPGSVVVGDITTLAAINYDIDTLMPLSEGIRKSIPYFKEQLS